MIVLIYVYNTPVYIGDFEIKFINKRTRKYILNKWKSESTSMKYVSDLNKISLFRDWH